MTQSLEHGVEQIQQAVAASESAARDENYAENVTLPPIMEVALPGGFLDIDGSLATTAVVRELNGYDEEVLARASSKKGIISAELLNIILNRCVESIGDEVKITSDLLDMLYMGDWDALLLGIRIASFGEEVKWSYTCVFCEQQQVVSVSLREDVKRRTLGDATFEYQGRRERYEVGYPKASVTRELLKLKNPTPADVVTETLLGSILSIPGKMIITRNDIRAMPTADREGIIQKIQEGAPAVLLGEVTKSCPGCEETVYVPLTLAALFQSRVAGV